MERRTGTEYTTVNFTAVSDIVHIYQMKVSLVSGPAMDSAPRLGSGWGRLRRVNMLFAQSFAEKATGIYTYGNYGAYSSIKIIKRPLIKELNLCKIGLKNSSNLAQLFQASTKSKHAIWSHDHYSTRGTGHAISSVRVSLRV